MSGVTPFNPAGEGITQEQEDALDSIAVLTADLTDTKIPRFDSAGNKFVDSSLVETPDKVILNKPMKLNKGLVTTGGSIQLGQNVKMGESASALIITDRQNRKFSVAQNLIAPTGLSATFVPRAGVESNTVRQGSDVQNTTVGSISWFDIAEDDRQINQFIFRVFTATTGVRLVVRKDGPAGDILIITEEDETWALGDGFTLSNGGDSLVPLVSSLAPFDGDVLHFTLEVFTGSFNIRGDAVVFGGQPIAFVPYFAFDDQSFDLQLLADGGGLIRRLTGDVAITPGTAAVVGTGTLFDTELFVGESIQIREENFTVLSIADATNFTLSGNHVAGAGAGIGGGLNAIVFAEDLVLDVKNFDGTSRLKVDRIGKLKHSGNQLQTTSNYITKIPKLIGTTAQTLGDVEGYQLTSTTATITNKIITAGGSATGVLIDTDTTGVFSINDIVLLDTPLNKGFYEVEGQLGSLIFARGVGGIANIEDWTEKQAITATETGVVTKVKVSVRRTSLTGTIEHGEGDTTPITYFQLAHADDVPIVAIEEFASSQERFFGELGLPSSAPNGTWILANGVEITLVDDIVFGINKQIVRFQDNSTSLNTDAKQSISPQNWLALFVSGGEFGGVVKCVAPSGANNYFFIGMGVSGANNPTASIADQRFGAFLQFDPATNAVIVNDLQGPTLVTLDGTSGTPKVLEGDYFEIAIRLDIGFVDPRWIVNGVDVGAATFGNSSNSNDVLAIASGSSAGVGNDFNVDNFGVTILEESTTKTISATSMTADSITIIVPSIARDFIVIFPDGNPRNVGDAIELVANNVGGSITLATQNVALPEAIFNGENTFTFDIDTKETLRGLNTVDNGNVYVGFMQTPDVSLIKKNLNVFREDFELGNFNNWTVVNDTTNQWFVGAAGTSTGNNGAFISNDGVNSNYDGLTVQVSHFFKDVIIPKGSTNLRLQFDWRGVGEGVGEVDFDFGRVYNAPTSVNPVAGVDLGGTNRIGLDNYNLQPTFLLNQIINLGDSFAGTTRRFIFQWLNDSTVTNIPAWEIDNIKFLVDLDGGELTVGNLKTTGFIDVGVLSGVEHQEGRIYYDDKDKALNLKTDIIGSTQSLGQEFWVRVINKTGTTIADGKAVFINGFDISSGRPTIALAKADALETSNAIGFATSTMLNNAEGAVTTMGFLNDLDTSGFTNGQEIFLSSTVSGGITATIPPIGIPMGFITNADVDGQLFTAISRTPIQPDKIISAFVSTEDVTVVNTVAETTLLGAGNGSLIIPADTTAIGDRFAFTIQGIISSTANPTLRLQLKSGGVLLADTGASSIGNLTNGHWIITGDVVTRTIGGAGTVTISGSFTTSAGDHFEFVNIVPVTIDTTINRVVDVTAIWGTAAVGNTITAQIASLTKFSSP